MDLIQGLRSGATVYIVFGLLAMPGFFQVFNGILAGMVSSKIWTLPSETITRYAQSESDVERLVGVVHACMAGGYCWPVLRPGRSPYRVSDGLRAGMSAFAN